MEKTARENFKAIIAAFVKATGRTEQAVSKQLYGNASFFEEFFAGRQTVSLKKLESMLVQLRDLWPPEVSWPVGRVIVFRGPERKLSPTKNKAA